ncbi:MAG: TolC family protein [Bacteroidales bacterium]|nr:TolC family protein [Bacteroidales bacterium]
MLYLIGSSSAQEIKSFTLKEAQQYAIENNYDVINAGTDVEIARKKVKENLAIGLPQVNASAGYSNYFELPTSLIPAEFMGGNPGEFAELQFGTQHNATWNASISQLLFSGQYIVALMATKAFVDLNETNYQKSEIEIKDIIARSYYPVIILKENKKVFDSTLVSLSKMLYETEEYYNAGFLEDTDVDQLKLLIADMQATITNIDNQLKIAYNMLKYQLGMRADDEIKITDNLENLLAEVDKEILLNSSFNFNNHIDYKLLKNKEEMAFLQMKLDQSQYYPTLSGFYQFQQDAMRNDFSFFNNDKWYTNQMLGIQLEVPIWSSGQRKNKVQQSKLEIEKLKVMDNQLQQGLTLKVSTVKSEFNNAYLIYLNRKMAVNNAEKIYQKTEVKYREGIANSLDLSQTYNQYLTNQIEYLTSILDLLNKKSELEKELTKVSY